MEAISAAATASLDTISSQLVDMVEEDVDVEGSSFTPSRRIPIFELFAFDNNHWVGQARRSAIGSLEDEMEYYKLLDLDADGEPEVLDYDIDDTLHSVFQN